ncbi:twin-arginine translocase TatA/TatE family subunit [Evansella clarkii]|uniref:twin-arginine translocase TatA/TatE family subunit n=1 Tax=Evansella clarkii TaxID=79879 RepID=UPI00099895E8|nr:twin-arginine translocase TatA/TatE family subunit [Evansella clarkii]
MGNIGPASLVLIVIIALLLFGPNKLPELGRAFGRTLKEFKDGTRDIISDGQKDEQEDRKEE